MSYVTHLNMQFYITITCTMNRCPRSLSIRQKTVPMRLPRAMAQNRLVSSKGLVLKLTDKPTEAVFIVREKDCRFYLISRLISSSEQTMDTD